MPKIPPEQIEQARGVDLLSYLQTHEPQSIRKCGAGEYCLVEHDSLKISNGRWNWFGRGFGGYSCLDFLIKVRGYTLGTVLEEVGTLLKRNEYKIKVLNTINYIWYEAPPEGKNMNTLVEMINSMEVREG